MEREALKLLEGPVKSSSTVRPTVRHWPIIGGFWFQVVYGLIQICFFVWFATVGWLTPPWYVHAIQGIGVPKIWCSLCALFLVLEISITTFELIIGHWYAEHILWDHWDRAHAHVAHADQAQELFHDQQKARDQTLENYLKTVPIIALGPPMIALSLGFIVLKTTNNPQCNALTFGLMLPWFFNNGLHGFARNILRLTSEIDTATIEDIGDVFRNTYAAGSQPKGALNPLLQEYWISALAKVQHFEDRLHEVWSVGAVALFASLACDGSQAFFCALIAATTTDFHIQVAFFMVLVLVCTSSMRTLYPLAAATARCQSMAPCSKGNRSIRQLAGAAGTLKMNVDAEMKYITFMSHMDRSNFGITIPVLGTVSISMLISKATILAAVVPTAFTVARNYLQKMNETYNHTGFNATA